MRKVRLHDKQPPIRVCCRLGIVSVTLLLGSRDVAADDSV